jgi:hypothetical protein
LLSGSGIYFLLARKNSIGTGTASAVGGETARCTLGETDGCTKGESAGDLVVDGVGRGMPDATEVGFCVGDFIGAKVGLDATVDLLVGDSVGPLLVGADVGFATGAVVVIFVGAAARVDVGSNVGDNVLGECVGFFAGESFGDFVGASRMGL